MGQAGKRASGKGHLTTDEARTLTWLMAQVSLALYRAREQELKPLGIPMMHSAVLYVL